MSSRDPLPEPHEDGSLPNSVHRSGIKYQVSKSNLDTNWLLNVILGTKDLQITKVSDDEVQKFLEIIDTGNLLMPDGELALEWLKKRLNKRYQESQSRDGETWYRTAARYGYIIEQVDMRLAFRGPQKGQGDSNG